MTTRAFDVVLFGASGFTGGLVAEYLARRPGGARWAIAGRDRAKLERVRERLGVPVEILIADARDGNALRALADKTTAIATTAGPFALHGSELVAACVERNTHYCDLTGEMQWVKRMADRHHEAARANGTRIVHSCGYDSLPSDLGVWVLQQHALATYGKPVREIEALAYIKNGTASGGTLASMLNIAVEAEHDKSVFKLLLDPYGLAPNPSLSTGKKSEPRGVNFIREAGVFTGPFLMAPTNTRIVHRSNALLDYLYGHDFEYRESMPTGRGVRGAAIAAAMTAAMNAIYVGASVSKIRNLMQQYVPQPGEGPSERARKRSSFAHNLYATLDGKRLRARFSGQGDPGYDETAKMIAESALCLALDPLSTPGGVLTGASAMGDALVKRLRAQNLEIEAWTVSD
ncbi:MAG TPA: saccharopine dehydrogenase NADP-binding domain-containing protein [Polyangiales bacterium]